MKVGYPKAKATPRPMGRLFVIAPGNDGFYQEGHQAYTKEAQKDGLTGADLNCVILAGEVQRTNDELNVKNTL